MVIFDKKCKKKCNEIQLTKNKMNLNNKKRFKSSTLPFRFGDKNRVKSDNFNATIPKFSEKFDHRFSHVIISANLFPESHGFVVTRCWVPL